MKNKGDCCIPYPSNCDVTTSLKVFKMMGLKTCFLEMLRKLPDKQEAHAPHSPGKQFLSKSKIYKAMISNYTTFVKKKNHITSWHPLSLRNVRSFVCKNLNPLHPWIICANLDWIDPVVLEETVKSRPCSWFNLLSPLGNSSSPSIEEVWAPTDSECFVSSLVCFEMNF